MAFEPLSTTTRKVRTSLNVFSVLSFAVAGYGVTVVNVPGVGFEIPVGNGFLELVLAVSNTYLLLSFLLYAFDDMSFMSKPNEMDLRSRNLSEQIKGVETKLKEMSASLDTDLLARPDDFWENLQGLRGQRKELSAQLRNVRFTSITWFRIYVWDVTLPIVIGIFASAAIWCRYFIA